MSSMRRLLVALAFLGAAEAEGQIYLGSDIAGPSTSADGNYTLHWDVPTGARPILQRSRNGRHWSNYPSTTPSTVRESVTTGGDFFYRVSGCIDLDSKVWDCDGRYGWGSPHKVTVTLPIPPRSYEYLATIEGPAVSSTGNVTLSWEPREPGPGEKPILQRNAQGQGWQTLGYTETSSVYESGLQPGDYDYRLSGCRKLDDKWECGSSHGWSDVHRVEVRYAIPASQVADQSVVKLPRPDSELMGAIPAESGVSGGEAIYRMPIEVPPGRRGMQPDVALSYRHTSGQGSAGLGWSLSAGGAIARAPQIADIDGRSTTIQFNADDRLALNGNRMILVSGEYGANGSEYRTEIDELSRITLLGGHINGNQGDYSQGFPYFRVDYKSGLTEWYSTRNTMSGAPVISQWLLTRVEDRQGNYISYEYDTLDQEMVLRRIRYTGFVAEVNGERVFEDGDRRIEFNYEQRPDGQVSYLSGAADVVSQRLTAIETFVPVDTGSGTTERTRRYELTYADSARDEFSMLTKVTTCVLPLGPCREPAENNPNTFQGTVFQYAGDADTALVTAGTPRQLWTDPVLNGIVRREDGLSVRLPFRGFLDTADYDGDGRSETLIVDMENNRLDRTLGSKKLKMSASGVTVDIRDELSPYATNLNTDLDLDGRADIIWNENGGDWGGGLVYVASWNDSAGDFTSRRVYGIDLLDAGEYVGRAAADFDADGKPDVITVRGRNADNSRNVHVHFQCDPVLSSGRDKVDRFNFCGQSVASGALPQSAEIKTVMDFDGNGVPDLLVRKEPARVGIYPTYSFLMGHSGGGRQVSFSRLDFSDIGGPHQSGLETAYKWGDINGDGLSDLLNPQSVFVNVGGRFEPASIEDYGYPHGTTGIWADLDDDGADELLIPAELKLSYCQEFGFGAEHTRIGPPLLVQIKSSPNENFVRSSAFFGGNLGSPQANGWAPVESYIKCSRQDLAPGQQPTSGNGLPIANDRGLYRWDVVDFSPELRFANFARDLHFKTHRQRTELIAPGTGGEIVTDVQGAVGLRFFLSVPVGTVGYTGPLNTGDTPVDPGNFDIIAPLGFYERDPSELGLGYGVFQTALSKPLRKLTVATDGLGKIGRWSYTIFTQRGQGDHTWDGAHAVVIPPGKYVDTYQASNGLGELNLTKYRYGDAVYNYRGRGFVGFQEIWTEQDFSDQANNLVTWEQFHYAFPFTGSVKAEKTWLASDFQGGTTPTAKPITETTTAWNSYARDGSDGTRYVFPYIDSVTVQESNLSDRQPSSSWITRKVDRFVYSPQDLPYGNVTQEIHAESNTHIASRSYDVTYRYDYGHLSDWWLDKRLWERAVFRPVGWSTPSLGADNPTIARRTDFEYYTSGQEARLPSRVTVQAGDETQELVKSYERYDRYGNPLLVITRAAKAPAMRPTSYGYSDDGYFLHRESNPEGHTVTTATDKRDGKTLYTIDANGLRTDYRYDALRRLATEISPANLGQRLHPQSDYRYQAAAGDATAPKNAVSKQILVQDGAPVRETFIDVLGRTLEVRETAFDGQRKVFAATSFDARGNKIRETMPGYAVEGYGATSWSGFDALGRPAKKTVHKEGYKSPYDKFVTTYRYDGHTTYIDFPGTSADTASRTYTTWGWLLGTVDTGGTAMEYRYDASGNLVLARDPKGNLTTASYDAMGRRTAFSDPNQGRLTFHYDGYGQIAGATDANGNVVRDLYDRLGRQTERWVTAPGGRETLEATFAYDVPTVGRRVSDMQHQHALVRTYGHDVLSRPSSVTLRVGGRELVTDTEYDGYYGWVKATVSPSGDVIGQRFTSHGYLAYQFDPLRPEPTGREGFYTYRDVLEMNARGLISRERYGNGLYRHVQATPSLSQITAICVSSNSALPVSCTGSNPLALFYKYEDPFANLTLQERRRAGLTVGESFTYDQLQRVRSSRRDWQGVGQLPAPLTVSYDYDELGNISRKTDFSADVADAYRYGDNSRSKGGAGPHAVREVKKADGTVALYKYDAMGNAIDANGRQLTYSYFNKPTRVESNPSGLKGGSSVSAFLYDPDHVLFAQTTDQGGVRTRTKYYAGSSYELEIRGAGDESHISYLGPVVIRRQGKQRDVSYLHTDRLDSTVAITDEAGQVEKGEESGYDPFGGPRDGSQVAMSERGSMVTDRGFTSHEHIDSQRLIHMGGRIYDYQLGRFLSVDPLVQTSTTQGFNRYSYVMNNALMATDPSGYSPEEEEGRRNQKRQLANRRSTTKGGARGHQPTRSNGAKNGSSTAPQTKSPKKQTVKQTVELGKTGLKAGCDSDGKCELGAGSTTVKTDRQGVTGVEVKKELKVGGGPAQGGVNARAELRRNRETGRTEVAVGAGADVQLGPAKGSVDAEGSASAGEYRYREPVGDRFTEKGVEVDILAKLKAAVEAVFGGTSTPLVEKEIKKKHVVTVRDRDFRNLLERWLKTEEVENPAKTTSHRERMLIEAERARNRKPSYTPGIHYR